MKKHRKEPEKLKRKDYEAALRDLQADLCHLQDWVRHTGARIIVVFEGRDAAGKGGTIRALTERVSPRVFRTVALPAPSDRERSQMHVQRYLAHFPAAGEIVIFDRSWYNRAGVERVVGFCKKPEYEHFRSVPGVREAGGQRRHPADQVLAGGERRGAEAPLLGPNRGPAAAVEAQLDGPALAPEVVRVLARP